MDGFVGEVRLFGGNFVPKTWAYCQGQLLTISQYTPLYSIIGTTYGGDGRTTFGLPDMRGRCAIGSGHVEGLSARGLGNTGGSETTTLTVDQLPAHTHEVPLRGGYGSGSFKIPVSSSSDLANEVENGYLGQGGTAPDMYAEDVSEGFSYLETFISSALVEGTLTFNFWGGGGTYYNLQPLLCLNYIICLTGTYPSRS